MDSHGSLLQTLIFNFFSHFLCCILRTLYEKIRLCFMLLIFFLIFQTLLLTCTLSLGVFQGRRFKHSLLDDAVAHQWILMQIHILQPNLFFYPLYSIQWEWQRKHLSIRLPRLDDYISDLIGTRQPECLMEPSLLVHLSAIMRWSDIFFSVWVAINQVQFVWPEKMCWGTTLVTRCILFNCLQGEVASCIVWCDTWISKQFGPIYWAAQVIH